MSIITPTSPLLPISPPTTLLNSTSSSTNNGSFHHLHFITGNAKSSAVHWCATYGFQPFARRDLTTGSRLIASHAVINGSAIMLFSSPIRSRNWILAQFERGGYEDGVTEQELKEALYMHDHQQTHGDAIVDIAFRVDDVQAVFDAAVRNGAKIVSGVEVVEEIDGVREGCVKMATILAFKETRHTFVEFGEEWKGVFLPGFVKSGGGGRINKYLPKVEVEEVDHCVSNYSLKEMEEACAYYEQSLQFHRFWSIDDYTLISSSYSGVKVSVMASPSNSAKMVICEPGSGPKKSQIVEYMEYNDGPGIAHIALRVPDIITAVTNLMERGVEFTTAPDSYYDYMRGKLEGEERGWKMREDIEVLRRLGILMDFDQEGYLLQIFTKPLSDRPTCFVEIIQRNSFEGFGAGNIRHLFEAVEREQAKRGNL